MDEDRQRMAEHAAWVRLECLKTAVRALPAADAAAQIAQAELYEEFVLEGLLEDGVMH